MDTQPTSLLMNLSVFYTTSTWVICLIQFVIMIGCIYIGRRFALYRRQDIAENAGNSSITNSQYGLLGLLLAFTFSMSASRFEERKKIIVDEANCIGTAILRTQLYADSVQPAFKDNFQGYVQARIAYFTSGADTIKIKESLAGAQHYADTLWLLAMQQSRIEGNLIPSNQMVPALNEMFDIANSRLWGELNRIPTSLLIMLFFLSLTTAFVAGYSSVGKGKFDWLMGVSFCVLTCLCIFFIIDMDKPRMGIITLDENVKALTDLRKMF